MSTQENPNGKMPGNNDEPKSELSPMFRYKIIMGVLMLLFAIYFIYSLIKILTR
jgi:hypothetical protein